MSSHVELEPPVTVGIEPVHPSAMPAAKPQSVTPPPDQGWNPYDVWKTRVLAPKSPAKVGNGN